MVGDVVFPYNEYVAGVLGVYPARKDFKAVLYQDFSRIRPQKWANRSRRSIQTSIRRWRLWKRRCVQCLWRCGSRTTFFLGGVQIKTLYQQKHLQKIWWINKKRFWKVNLEKPRIWCTNVHHLLDDSKLLTSFTMPTGPVTQVKSSSCSEMDSYATECERKLEAGLRVGWLQQHFITKQWNHFINS